MVCQRNWRHGLMRHSAGMHSATTILKHWLPECFVERIWSANYRSTPLYADLDCCCFMTCPQIEPHIYTCNSRSGEALRKSASSDDGRRPWTRPAPSRHHSLFPAHDRDAMAMAMGLRSSRRICRCSGVIKYSCPCTLSKCAWPTPSLCFFRDEQPPCLAAQGTLDLELVYFRRRQLELSNH